MKSTGIWYLLFVSIACVFALVVEPPIPIRGFGTVKQLDKGMQKYAAGKHPTTVLLGPSYVGRLGSVDGAVNLGYGGARPKEVNHIQSTLSDDDLVIYIVTIRDMWTADKPMRRSILYAPTRRLLFWKFAVSNGVRWGAAAPKTKPRVASFQILGAVDKRVNELDIETHPNRIVVLFPTFPQSCPDATLYVSKFQDMIFAAYPLAIDLSDMLQPHHFIDFCHYTAEGKHILRQEIAKVISQYERI